MAVWGTYRSRTDLEKREQASESGGETYIAARLIALRIDDCVVAAWSAVSWIGAERRWLKGSYRHKPGSRVRDKMLKLRSRNTNMLYLSEKLRCPAETACFMRSGDESDTETFGYIWQSL